VVSRRTGLTPALLRAWEKRYGVVAPSRSEGGQRLYSDEDVYRLSLLHRAVTEGRNISQVAGLSPEELQALVEEDQTERVGPGVPEPIGMVPVSGILERAREAVLEMNPNGLERVLTRGAMSVPVPLLIDEVLLPLLEGIGISWREGRLGPAHEHLASVVVRRFLEWLLNTVDVGQGAPVLVAATPALEKHELGALLSAVSAASEGWKAVYLGPDLPATEIASAARVLGAQVVTLSLLDPSLTETFPGEITALRRILPASIRVVVGGAEEILPRVAGRVEDVEFLESLSDLRENLRESALRF